MLSEHVYEVPPLAPADAVELFRARAEAAGAGLDVGDDALDHVRSICARLEGLPLAIELAAVRLRTLPPLELLDRLDRRLPLLTRGPRDAAARHQTLRRTIDWSYDLLSPSEQQLLERLGVFAGGFVLEAAEEVCDGDLDSLTALLDWSVLRQRRGPALRFELLETIREYAVERLEARGDMDPLRRRHALYFLAFAESAEQELAGAEQATWLARLQEEHDNLRAALAWARDSGENELELRLAASLGRFWYVRGFVREGLGWVVDALARGADQPDPLRAKAARAASALAVIHGDYGRARAFAEEGLAVYRRLGDRAGVARSLSNLGAIVLADGDVPLAASLLDEGLALARELGEPRLVALVLNNRGDVALTEGDFELAGTLFAESLGLFRDLDDTVSLARSLFNLGAVALEQGDERHARQLLGESIALCREVGDQEDVAWCLVALAALATRGGEPARGALLLGRAETLIEGMGASLKPYERGLHERVSAALSAELGGETLATALERGRALDGEDTVAYAAAFAKEHA